MKPMTEKQVLAVKKLVDKIAKGATTEKQAIRMDDNISKLINVYDRAYEILNEEFDIPWEEPRYSLRR